MLHEIMFGEGEKGVIEDMNGITPGEGGAGDSYGVQAAVGQMISDYILGTLYDNGIGNFQSGVIRDSFPVTDAGSGKVRISRGWPGLGWYYDSSIDIAATPQETRIKLLGMFADHVDTGPSGGGQFPANSSGSDRWYLVYGQYRELDGQSEQRMEQDADSGDMAPQTLYKLRTRLPDWANNSVAGPYASEALAVAALSGITGGKCIALATALIPNGYALGGAIAKINNLKTDAGAAIRNVLRVGDVLADGSVPFTGNVIVQGNIYAEFNSISGDPGPTPTAETIYVQSRRNFGLLLHLHVTFADGNPVIDSNGRWNVATVVRTPGGAAHGDFDITPVIDVSNSGSNSIHKSCTIAHDSGGIEATWNGETISVIETVGSTGTDAEFWIDVIGMAPIPA